MSNNVAPLINNKSLDYYKRQVFQAYLDIDGLTEIAVNRPGEVWTEINGEWLLHKDEKVSFDFCKRFSQTLASFRGDEVGDTKPLLSATLESGERVQVVFPPACERNTISITIRKPSTRQITHKEYINRGFYDYVKSGEKYHSHDDTLLELFKEKKIDEFMEFAVKVGKNIVYAGETGSGKTTYMKSLIDFIPLSARLITIEDAEEITFFIHKNYVHLFYPSESGSDSGSIITAAKLIKSCLRMKPDRILLAEVKGGDAWDFIKVAGSGHRGSMTSIHAGSAKDAIIQMVTKCYQNVECQNLPFDVLKKIILDNIDIVVHVGRDGVVRHMSDIYFKGAECENV